MYFYITGIGRGFPVLVANQKHSNLCQRILWCPLIGEESFITRKGSDNIQLELPSSNSSAFVSTRKYFSIWSQIRQHIGGGSTLIYKHYG